MTEVDSQVAAPPMDDGQREEGLSGATDAESLDLATTQSEAGNDTVPSETDNELRSGEDPAGDVTEDKDLGLDEDATEPPGAVDSSDKPQEAATNGDATHAEPGAENADKPKKTVSSVKVPPGKTGKSSSTPPTPLVKKVCCVHVVHVVRA